MLRLEAMPRMEADLAAIRTELGQERKARIDAEQQAAVLAAQKSDLDSRLADLKTSSDRLTQQMVKAQERVDQLGSALGDARVATQTSQARIDDLTAQLERARAEAREAGDKLAVLSSKLAPAA